MFLGYHAQPGHKWQGEYLVAKLEALDYHVERNSLTIHRTKKIELLPGGFSFPLRVKQDRKEAIPDDPKLNLIESPNPIPLADADLAEYTPSEAPEGEPEQRVRNLNSKSLQQIRLRTTSPTQRRPGSLSLKVFTGMVFVCGEDV